LSKCKSDVCLTRRHEGSTSAPSHTEGTNAGFRRKRHTGWIRALFNGQSFYYVCFQVVLAELVGIGWRWTSNQLAQLGASLEYAAGNASNWSHLLSSQICGISVLGRWECGLLHVANDAKVTSNNGRAEELYLRLTITRQNGYCARPNKCYELSADSMHLVPLGRVARSLGFLRRAECRRAFEVALQ
jgi:hypothetical protein